MTRSLEHVCCASLLVILLAAVGWGQKDSGTIVGTVKDASDADRGTSFTTATNASGEYVAGPLKVGHYRVAVEKADLKQRWWAQSN